MEAKYTALVRATHNENPYYAVKSVLDSAGSFCQLIIVKPDYDAQYDAQHYYAHWEAQRRSLENARIEVLFVGNVESDDELEAYVAKESAGVLELSPYLKLTKPALVKWLRHVHARALAAPELTHFGLRAELDLNEDEPLEARAVLRGFYYGYLMVVLMCEWWWALWERFKVAHRPHDAVLRLMLQKGAYRYLPRRAWKTRYCVNDQWDALQYAGKGAVVRPLYTQRGARFAQLTVHEHSHMRWGLWVFAYAVHFTYFVVPVMGLAWRIAVGGLGLPNNEWLTSGMALQWLFQYPLTLYVVYSRANFPLTPLVALFYPLYVTSFPLVFIAWKVQSLSFQRAPLTEENEK